MHKEPPRILAINPGTRYIGIAAFRGPELLDWGVKVVAGKMPRKKVEAARVIILDLIEQYLPDALAIKRLHPSRSSRPLDELARMIEALARQRGLTVCQYSIQELQNSLYPDAKPNKRKLAGVLAAMYPALVHDLHRETESRNPYRVRMFEAVALAVVCYQQLENK